MLTNVTGICNTYSGGSCKFNEKKKSMYLPCLDATYWRIDTLMS